MNSMVSSQALFTTIVSAIKDVEQQARDRPRQSIKDMKRQRTGAEEEEKKKAKVSSSRQIPMHARLGEQNTAQP